jgi:hypothetical protein
MRVLVCIPHFFNRDRTDQSEIMGSSVDPLEQRIETVRYCLRGMQAMLADNAYLLRTSPESSVGFDRVESMANRITGDICLCVAGENHFFSDLTTGNVIKGLFTARDPRLLGYACRRMFAENVDRYDLYFFTEDDNAVLDAEFFDKAAHFYDVFGENKLLLPNRFELGGIGEVAWKVYIDEGAFGHRVMTPPAMAEPMLRLRGWGRDIEFALTGSPFSGAYIITNAQLRAWMQEPDFVEPDPELAANMDLMELAGIPLRGRLPIYKAAKTNADFFEIHHVPNRACNGTTPQQLMKEMVMPEVERRAASSLRRS